MVFHLISNIGRHGLYNVSSKGCFQSAIAPVICFISRPVITEGGIYPLQDPSIVREQRWFSPPECLHDVTFPHYRGGVIETIIRIEYFVNAEQARRIQYRFHIGRGEIPRAVAALAEGIIAIPTLSYSRNFLVDVPRIEEEGRE